MELDYSLIGKRVARRRRALGLTQAQLSEMIETSTPYISNIERAVSIPSTEVIMRLAKAMGTTPDEFLVDAVRYSHHNDQSYQVAELLHDMNKNQLMVAKNFLSWLKEQDI